MLMMTTSIVVTGIETFEKFGPRATDIIFKVAGSLTAEANDLETGQIDLMDWAVPSDKVDAWDLDPDITMGAYDEAGWYEFDLNLQMWPIGHGAMDGVTGAEPTRDMNWEFPDSWDEGHYWINYSCQRDLDAKKFRQAIAHLTNRDQLDTQFPGTIAPMETFIFPIIGGWENPAAPKYAYSITLANNSLNAGGFMDYDDDGRREYCKHVTEREAWLAGGPVPPDVEEIPDIQLWRRTDDPIRSYAGELLRDDLGSLGVYVDDQAGSYGTCAPHAWKYYDYHIYTGGWGWGTVPDMYYELFHSDKDIYPLSDGDNYNRYHRQEYDALAQAFKEAATQGEAATALDACQVMAHDDVACIPLYTMSGYVAHRTNYGDFPGEQQYKGLPWEGFVNEQGSGYYGSWVGYSALNAHPQGYEKGGVIRHGLIEPPDILDPMDSESFYEWCILSKIYDPLLMNDPNDVTVYVPWLCSSYSEGTWVNPEGDTCSKVRVELIPNVLFHDNELLEPEDINFTYHYMQDAMAISSWSYTMDFHHMNWTGNAIDIYYNITSWLVLDYVGTVPILPMHIWESIPPTVPGDNTVPGSWAYNPELEDTLIGTGPFRCNKDDVIGRIDRTLDEFFHLEANPTYFRKLVRPDFVTAGPTPTPDGNVDLDDFMTAVGQFGTSYPTWNPTYGPIADVNKDRVVDIDDLMEIAVRYGGTGYNNGYPPYYT